MLIQRSLHIDKSEPDENGMYDYYYEYEVFEFSDGPEKIIARSYIDTPAQACFLCKEINAYRQLLVRDDLQTRLIKDAAKYLADQGKSDISWLSGKGVKGYEPIDV